MHKIGDILVVVGGTAQDEGDLGDDNAKPWSPEDRFHFLKFGAIVEVVNIITESIGSDLVRYYVRPCNVSDWVPGEEDIGNYVRPHHVEAFPLPQLNDIHSIESFLDS